MSNIEVYESRKAVPKWLEHVRVSLNQDNLAPLLQSVVRQRAEQLKVYRENAELPREAKSRQQAKEQRRAAYQRLRVLGPAYRLLCAYRQQLLTQGAVARPQALALHLLAFATGWHEAILLGTPRDAKWLSLAYFSAAPAQRKLAMELLRSAPELFGKQGVPGTEPPAAAKTARKAQHALERLVKKILAANILTEKEAQLLKTLR